MLPDDIAIPQNIDETRTRANSIQLLSKHFCMYGLDLILGRLNFFFQNECGLGETNDLLVFQNLGNISSLANKPILHTTAESTTTGPCVPATGIGPISSHCTDSKSA